MGDNQPSAAIALYGDKLKPREDQCKGGNGFGVNEEGAGYTLTAVDRHGVAYGIGHGSQGGSVMPSEEAQPTLVKDDHKGPMPAVVQCYDMTHADDPGRKVADGVSPTLQSRMGTGGNQVPLTVSTQGLDGYNKTLTGDCAPTISGAACDIHHTHGVISTNSNGEDVAATISANMSKLGGDNQTTFGGGTASPAARKERTMGIGRDVIECGKAAKFAPDIQDECSPTIRAKTPTNGVMIAKEGAEGE